MSVRSVTPAEISFFQNQGWVYLPGLVNMAAIPEFLDEAREAFALQRLAGDYGEIVARSWTAYVSNRDRVHAKNVIMAPTMGKNVSQLLDAPQVRLETSLYLIKTPESEGNHAETIYHQDFPAHPFDRSNLLTVWIALHDMPAEMGTMRFYEGSHMNGVFGQAYADGISLSERVKSLRDKVLSPPLNMKAGDATVHHCLTIHGAPPNYSHDPRWAFAILYTDADARYNGNSVLLPPGVEIEYMAKFEHPAYPLVPQE